jgi:hypothetical protein
MCDLCGDAGTLRDGNPCPRCSVSKWVERGEPVVLFRRKRIVWVRPERAIAPADQKGRGNQRPSRG